jgi:hypothetical protein
LAIKELLAALSATCKRAVVHYAAELTFVGNLQTLNVVMLGTLSRTPSRSMLESIIAETVPKKAL